MSRATERFAREAALEVERLADERRRWREGSAELARLAEQERLTGAHVAAHIAKSDRIDADEEALRRRYFPKSARLMVSDWDGSVITVSPTGRLRTVYVPGPTPECADEHRDWEHQALPWVCSLEPGHDGDHVAMVTDSERGDRLEVSRWPARTPAVEPPMPHDDEHGALPVIGDTVALSDGSTARVLARYDANAEPSIANKWQITGPLGARVISLDEIVGYPDEVPA